MDTKPNQQDIPDWMNGEWDETPASEVDKFNWKTQTPGVTGKVAAWILSQSQYPQPEMSIAAALALVSVLKAHKVRTQTDLRTNILLANIAPSGSGKNWPLEAVKKILEALNVSQGMLLGEPASDAGLLSNLRLCQDKGLLIWDEFGDALKQLTSNSAGTYQREILATAKKLFSSASSVYTGKAYSDGSQRQQLVLKQPCLSVLGASTPERLYSALSSNLVEDGFLSRFLFVEPVAPEVREVLDIVRHSPPAELLFELNQLLRLPTNSEIPLSSTIFESLEIKPRIVPLSDKARLLARAYGDYYKEEMKACDGQGDLLRAIWARGMEHTLKVALVVADGIKIDVPEIWWAFEFVSTCISSLVEKFGERVAENTNDKIVKRVYGCIQRKGQITHSDLVRNTNGISTREREEAIETLIQSESIEKVTDCLPGSSKMKTFYIAK